ncbi:MAG: hypothetical protein SFV17_02950 [Candidatus Obscuribacter sp.]|nr:hypothetical protein [Candidatus Obscuribacter sp.]
MPKSKPNNVFDFRTGKPLPEATNIPTEVIPKADKPGKTSKSKPKADAGVNTQVKSAKAGQAQKPAKKATTTQFAYKWEFKPRFRKGAFGWKSQPAISRIKEAVSEIKKVAKKDPALAADGAVILLEKLSPALEHVDSSSGAIGSAVNKAIETLVPIISTVAVDECTRKAWLERLWTAMEEDHMPYIEYLGDFWGELCATKELATESANELLPCVRLCFSSTNPGTFFHGTTPCLSALLKAERYDEILELLAQKERTIWNYRKFGVKALVKLGKFSEAVDYAEKSGRDYLDRSFLASACEEVLLQAGRSEEAYRNYAIDANRQGTYIATFRSIAKKYPEIDRKHILQDLINAFPGEEGKWFATAKELGEFDLALELARKSPCDPKTLSRALKEHTESHPQFALNAGLCALHWFMQGYGYEVTGLDVLAAFKDTMKVAQALGVESQVKKKLTEVVEHRWAKKDPIAEIIGRQLR